MVVAFAFMIGPASSRYFEGILLITVRKPYDIGDRISISDPIVETDEAGSNGWIVEKVDLYTTTVRYAHTREVATIANGTLASTRIINMNRSKKALVRIYLKFGVNIPYSKVEELRTEVTKFVKDRPRQWLALNSFRSTRIEADLGYIEYVVILQHRESWQSLPAILNSKAEFSSYCLELQKKLGMKYIAPRLPVDLNLSSSGAGGAGGGAGDQSQLERADLNRLFASTPSSNLAAGVSLASARRSNIINEPTSSTTRRRSSAMTTDPLVGSSILKGDDDGEYDELKKVK